MSGNNSDIVSNSSKLTKNIQASPKDAEVLAMLLIAFPQVSKVAFDPLRRSLTLTFLCKGPISYQKQKDLESLYLLSIDVYNILTKQKAHIVDSYWEAIDEFYYFHVERDVSSLFPGELNLTVSLITDQISVVLDLDVPVELENDIILSNEFFLQEILDRIRELKCSTEFVALREGDKVIVFHK